MSRAPAAAVPLARARGARRLLLRERSRAYGEAEQPRGGARLSARKPPLSDPQFTRRSVCDSHYHFFRRFR